MSYDFIIFMPVPGEDPLETVDALLEEAEHDAVADDAPHAQALAECAAMINERLGEVVICNAFATMAELNISYSSLDGMQSRAIFDRLQRIFDEAGARWGLAVFDPQTGEVVAQAKALGRGAAQSATGVDTLRSLGVIGSSPQPSDHDEPRTGHGSSPAQRRPWWMFWRR